MNKYEAVIILNPNLSTKVDSFLKEFTSLLSGNSFSIIKTEDVGRRQLAYSINNHNKGHYLLFNIEGDPSKLIDIENKIKYNESIIRHLFVSVKEHDGGESYLFAESKNKKKDTDEDTENQTSQTEEQVVNENTDDDSVEGNEVEVNAENEQEEQEEEVKDE
jgi:small subunit ribosomal protein S6